IGSLEVSVIGLGTNNFGWSLGSDAPVRVDEQRARAVLAAAFDAGINFIDTADAYGDSEAVLGELLGTHRDEIVLATKFGLPHKGFSGGGSSPYVREAIDRSLKRLRTDRIDLYLYHRPDPETPPEETFAALAELRRDGKIREIGCSNVKEADLVAAIS